MPWRPANAEDPIEIRSMSGPWKAAGERQVELLLGSEVPTQKYNKDVIRLGTYVKDSEGLVFRVGLDTMLNWVVQFQRMRANGVKVPIPAMHRGQTWEALARTAGDPRNNMGWVDNLTYKDGTLWMQCTLIGNDALTAAQRSDVSLNSPPKFVDGYGNDYARPITHVAMVTDPVVPGLGEFIPIAASIRLQESVPMLEFLQKVAALLGIDASTITDEATGMQVVMTALEKALGKPSEPAKPAAPTAQASAEATPAPVTPVAAPAPSTGTVKKVSVDFTASQSPMMVGLLKENRAMKLSALVSEGKITPAQKTTLESRYCNDEAIGLELSSGSDGAAFNDLVTILSQNVPIVNKTNGQGKTGPQTISLADPSKSKNEPAESPVVLDAKRRQEENKKSSC